MSALRQSVAGKDRSLRALEWTNFFLADVQTGVGPFLAAYLASEGWKPGRVGIALTVGGVTSVVLQTPAGGIVDDVRAKRSIIAVGTLVLAAGAVLLAISAAPVSVFSAQVFIGGAGSFLAPTLAAITMGLVGPRLFDCQFGRNQSFNSAGNVACALAIAWVSHALGSRAIFVAAAALTVPTVLSVFAVRGDDIDFALARGGRGPGSAWKPESVLRALMGDRVLLTFFLCAFLFHFANAAMLPELGEMLAKGSAGSAAPFMSACIVVTQVVIVCTAARIGRYANAHGRKPLLLLGFGVLPLRALLYTLARSPAALVAIQTLDGVANAIFGVVSVLVVADRTQGTGRFNLMQGGFATAVGIGAALSNTFGGKLVDLYGFRRSFLALAGVATVAFCVLWLGVPETQRKSATP